MRDPPIFISKNRAKNDHKIDIRKNIYEFYFGKMEETTAQKFDNDGPSSGGKDDYINGSLSFCDQES